jgi:quercetin dioxygenase-like cupin family protein
VICGKVWGDSRTSVANGSVELHRIRITKGARCSEHQHQSKWNGFYVLAGKIAIHVWKSDYDLRDTTILGPGDFCEVRPGEYHQFEAIEDTDAMEVYWASLNHCDIKRRSVGAA